MINWAGWVDVGRGFRGFELVVVPLMQIESYIVGLIVAGVDTLPSRHCSGLSWSISFTMPVDRVTDVIIE